MPKSFPKTNLITLCHLISTDKITQDDNPIKMKSCLTPFNLMQIFVQTLSDKIITLEVELN